jgi:hypothetical protein
MSSIIKRTEIQQGPTGAPGPTGPALPATAVRARGPHAKQVELVRVGARIHALELRCSCGETTLIELDYPEDSPTGAAR